MIFRLKMVSFIVFFLYFSLQDSHSKRKIWNIFNGILLLIKLLKMDMKVIFSCEVSNAREKLKKKVAYFV